jgi:hypothetical protein
MHIIRMLMRLEPDLSMMPSAVSPTPGTTASRPTTPGSVTGTGP